MFSSWIAELLNKLWNKIKGKKDNSTMAEQAVNSFNESVGLPTLNESNLSENVESMQSAKTIDDNGVQQLQVDASSPIASASNVIKYDPNKSALDNMLGYAVDNNSASAYSAFLSNKYQSELADTALSRAIKDAEANGISKYQLFQSGNMAAATPSSAGASYQSYENALNRRESWSEKELAAIIAIITATINSAGKLIRSF